MDKKSDREGSSWINYDKRGWLRVVEVFLAVLLILGVLFFQIEDISPGSKHNILLIERGLLKEIARNNSLRDNVLTYDLSSGPTILSGGGGSQITNYVATRIPSGVDFAVMVCMPEDPCLLQGQKRVFATDTFISSTLSLHSPRKLKIFMWDV